MVSYSKIGQKETLIILAYVDQYISKVNTFMYFAEKKTEFFGILRLANNITMSGMWHFHYVIFIRTMS